ELAVRAAASIADKSLGENRAVGLTAYGNRLAVIPADRGGRQYLKIMQLLAAVEGDGSTPLVERLLASLPRLRRGMTAVVITPSLDRAWVRPLASLRARGIATVVIAVRAEHHEPGTDPALQARALGHALAEYELLNYVISGDQPLGTQLARVTR
ncbi:MAG TPA: hypothetical protein VKR24_09990, partial [Candidatus Limnocylindrales bacterium]|nr:hypothetical protein [Candidatus Limnocylindrales bacterium]